MEPKIRAKLVLDTSEIGKGLSGGGSRSSSGVSNKSEKLLQKLVKGQVPISGLSGKLLSVLVGGAGGLGAMFGIPAAFAAGFAVLSEKLAGPGGSSGYNDTLNENASNINDELKEGAKKLLDEFEAEIQRRKDAGENTEELEKEQKKITKQLKTANVLGETVENYYSDWSQGTGGIVDFTEKIRNGATVIADKMSESEIGQQMTDFFDNLVGINRNLKSYKNSIPSSFSSASYQSVDPNIDTSAPGASNAGRNYSLKPLDLSAPKSYINSNVSTGGGIK